MFVSSAEELRSHEFEINIYVASKILCHEKYCPSAFNGVLKFQVTSKPNSFYRLSFIECALMSEMFWLETYWKSDSDAGRSHQQQCTWFASNTVHLLKTEVGSMALCGRSFGQ